MPTKPKKEIRAEEMTRIEAQIAVHEKIKGVKRGEYDTAMKAQDEQIEILNVKLDAMNELEKVEQPIEEAEEKVELIATLTDLKAPTEGIDLDKKTNVELIEMIVDVKKKAEEKDKPE